MYVLASIYVRTKLCAVNYTCMIHNTHDKNDNYDNHAYTNYGRGIYVSLTPPHKLILFLLNL